MNHIISLHRIKLLLYADAREHRTYIYYGLIFFLAFFCIFMGSVIIWLTNKFHNTEMAQKQIVFYFVGVAFYFIFYCRYIGLKIHQRKGMYLLLPANTIEKFIVLLLEGIFLFLAYNLLFWICIRISSWIMPQYLACSFEQLIHTRVTFSPMLPPLVMALMFLSFVTFRRNAFIITILGYGVCIGLLFITLSLLYLSSNDMEQALQQGYISDSAFVNMSVWLKHYSIPAFSFLVFVILYIAYLKIKEKELR